jgi:hypothetical protein
LGCRRKKIEIIADTTRVVWSWVLEDHFKTELFSFLEAAMKYLLGEGLVEWFKR